MSKLFVMMAITAPTAVEFQIHQVVLTFQINSARYISEKNFTLENC